METINETEGNETKADDSVQETASLETTKVKKGLSLSRAVVILLESKAKEVSKSQSDVADQVLSFALPYYEKDAGIERLTISNAQGVEERSVGPEEIDTAAEAADVVIPSIEGPPLKRGRPVKLRIPGQQLPGPSQFGGHGETGNKSTIEVAAEALLQGSSPDGQVEDGLYRPGMGVARGVPVSGPAVEPTYTLSQLEEVVARVIAAHQPVYDPVLPPGPNVYRGPGDMQPEYPQQPEQPVYPQQPQQPVQPQQFAASYPPGYTGPPGVGVAPAQPQPEGIYPYPGHDGQYAQPVAQPAAPGPAAPGPATPAQPAYMGDPYSRSIANQGNKGQPLTAQSLLSGGGMTPNMQGQNTNMNYASAALGQNWRQNLHSMTAQNRRQ